MVGLHLYYNKSKDNDYKNSGDSPIPQKEESNYEGNNENNENNNAKPLAKLLVVDDDVDIVEVLKLGLLKNRFLVNAFTNPEEALQSFKSNSESYCLMLSDIRMPGLSGMQLARKVKEINSGVKVVLMTSFEIRDSEFSKVFPSTHVDGFVQKPIGIRDLTNKILSLVGESKRRREGENTILVYPSLQSFRQIYTKYVKEQLSRDDSVNYSNSNNNRRYEHLKPRIILIATFYETIYSVKHHLSAVGIKGVQSLMDNGSLMIVDAFTSYFPDVDGMKKLVASLSQRARKEDRAGVTAIIDMGFFFLFGGDGTATQLIKYESTLAPKTEGCNIRGFSCYHAANYNTLKNSQKEELAQGQKKKLLEVTGSTTTS